MGNALSWIIGAIFGDKEAHILILGLDNGLSSPPVVADLALPQSLSDTLFRATPQRARRLFCTGSRKGPSTRPCPVRVLFLCFLVPPEPVPDCPLFSPVAIGFNAEVIGTWKKRSRPRSAMR